MVSFGTRRTDRGFPHRLNADNRLFQTDAGLHGGAPDGRGVEPMAAQHLRVRTREQQLH